MCNFLNEQLTMYKNFSYIISTSIRIPPNRRSIAMGKLSLINCLITLDSV
jgi:hypothetical protein